MHRHCTILIPAVACLLGSHSAHCLSAHQDSTATIVDVRKIWSQPTHKSSFTDLVRYKNAWICCFREGAAHSSDDGRIQIITSSDGNSWKGLAKIECPPPNKDLRDPKLSITPDNQLLLTSTAYLPRAECRSYTWLSQDGKNWGEPHAIGPPGEWLWRTVWHKGLAYNFGRSEKPHKYLQLYRSVDGKSFHPHGSRQFDGIYVNETAPVFLPDGTCVTLLRRDSELSTAQLGTSKPPFDTWHWTDLGVGIGGPAMIRLPDGRMLAAVRLYDGHERTSLCWIDVRKGKLQEILKLPSGGDTSYAGMVWHQDMVWISYYSSHEENTSIYLARVRIP